MAGIPCSEFRSAPYLMWIYWLMFLVPAFLALSDRRLTLPVFNWPWLREPLLVWALVAMVVALVVGARYQVGGDWFNYLRNLDFQRGMSLQEALEIDDPGYRLLSWLVLHLDWGPVGLNLLTGTVFAIGLAAFCRAMPQPWLALAVAMPYMVVVVAMGYTRQGVALGLAMLGLLALQRQRVAVFLVCVVLGATFHKSAVLLLPIAALAATRNRYWSAAWAAVVSILAYQLLLEESVDKLITNYIEAEYQSEGAFIRLAMNVVPAVLLLRWRYSFFPDRTERNLWVWFAIISLGLLGVFYLTPASTAVDRVALYMLPLQLVVFSRVPAVFGSARGAISQWTLIVLSYYALVMFVWLNFADHAKFWIPYNFYFFEVMMDNIAPLR